MPPCEIKTADFDAGFAKAHRHIQVAARSRRQNATPLGAVDYDIADIVDARRIGRHRIARVDDRRRFGDFDFDAIRHIFRFGGGRCKHGGNGLADKTHDVMGQDRLFNSPIVKLVQHRPDRPRLKIREAND